MIRIFGRGLRCAILRLTAITIESTKEEQTSLMKEPKRILWVLWHISTLTPLKCSSLKTLIKKIRNAN